MLASIWTPLRRIACSTAAGVIGSAPCWMAAPMTKMFADEALPRSDSVQAAGIRQASRRGVGPTVELRQQFVERRDTTIRAADHRTGGRRAGRSDHDRVSRAAREQRPSTRRSDEIEREQHVGGSVAEQVRLGGVSGREPEVADHRPGLLGQAGLVHPAAVVAVEHRRGREDLRGGHHTGATDPGDPDVDVRRIEQQHRIGEVGRWLRHPLCRSRRRRARRS